SHMCIVCRAVAHALAYVGGTPREEVPHPTPEVGAAEQDVQRQPETDHQQDGDLEVGRAHVPVSPSGSRGLRASSSSSFAHAKASRTYTAIVTASWSPTPG